MNEVLEKEDEGNSSDDDNSDESSEYEDYSGKLLHKYFFYIDLDLNQFLILF